MARSEPRVPDRAAVWLVWERASSPRTSICSRALHPSLVGRPEAPCRGVDKSLLLFPRTPSLLCGFFSAVSNSCSAAFTVPKSRKVKLAHVNTSRSHFLGPETASHRQGCNSQSVLCRSQPATGEVAHCAPRRWVSTGCCSSTRGFGKNFPALQLACGSWPCTRAWPWSDSPVVFHHVKGTWCKLSGGKGEVRVPENVKEQIETVSLSRGGPCTSRDNYEWHLK